MTLSRAAADPKWLEDTGPLPAEQRPSDAVAALRRRPNLACSARKRCDTFAGLSIADQTLRVLGFDGMETRQRG
jgi:hypothetical protein